VRFIAAIVFFVIAVVGVGLGIAQRTVWAPPDRVTAELALESAATVTVIDGSALNAYEGRQTIDIIGGVVAAPVPQPEPSETPALGETPAPPADPNAPTETEAISAAYGRTTDVMAWVGDAGHNLVTWDAENQVFVTETVSGTESVVPQPYGGDLWYGDYQGEGQLAFTVNVPDDVSVLIVSDGVLPAPQQLSVTWPLDATTPFSTVLILGGVAALVIGLLLLLWALLLGPWWMIFLGLVAGYGFAWVSHLVVERNRPASFRHPWWSLISDLRMAGLMVSGRLDDELRKAGVTASSQTGTLT